MDLLRMVIAILLPPLGVFLQVGIGKQSWIDVLLTTLGVWLRLVSDQGASSKRQVSDAERGTAQETRR